MIRLGQTLGIGWRYSIYKSVLGWCNQLEMTDVASAGCGDLLPAGEGLFGSVGHGGPADGPESVDGFVGAGVAEVWITSHHGQRFPTVLMPLAPAGFQGSAFVGIVPAGATAASVEALDAEGEVLKVYDLN